MSDSQTVPPHVPGPSFAIIILNLNGRDVLLDCLASLRNSDYRDFFTIVVDNGSTDDSVATVQRDYPEVRVVAAGQNLGFTGGNNVGMERALAQGARYLMLLNNDTIVEKECLGHLVNALTSSPAIGAATPRILFHDPHDRIWSAGGDYSLWRGIARHRGLRRKDDDPQFNQSCDVGFITGCALCVKREVVEKIGLLDNDLFIYNEDTDYSLRIREAGFRIRYVPSALIWHREGYDSRRAAGQKRRLHLCTRNILQVHAKHRRWYHLITFIPYFLFRWVLLSGGYALLRGDRETAAGILSGIRAYFAGESGPWRKD